MQSTIKGAILLLLSLQFVGTTPVSGQGMADSAAIRTTALDYIEGWYTGDAARMERALHPETAKRLVYEDPRSGRDRLDQQGAMTLVLGTRAGYGEQIPEERRLKEVTVLDIHGDVASVKIVAANWIDYLHLAQWNGEWKIVNVLWELTPLEDEQ